MHSLVNWMRSCFASRLKVITTQLLSRSLQLTKKANGVQNKGLNLIQYTLRKSNAKGVSRVLTNVNRGPLKDALIVMMSLSAALLPIFRSRRLSKSIIHKKRKMLSKNGSQLRKKNLNNQRKRSLLKKKKQQRKINFFAAFVEP